MQFSSILTSILIVCPVLAAPKAQNTCIVSHTDGEDDGPNIQAAIDKCGLSDSVIEFEHGVHYNLWTPVRFLNMDNVEIRLYGNFSIPDNITYVQEQVVNESAPTGNWLAFTGSNVTIRGNPSNQWGWIDGKGQPWYNLMNTSYTVPNRPKAMCSFQLKDSVVEFLKITMAPNGHVGSSGLDNVVFRHCTLYSVSNNDKFPFNTDGFGLNGQNIIVEHSDIYNGDDCVTMGSGTANVLVRNIRCFYGHGVSIGSLGSNVNNFDTVTNFTAENVYVKDSLYGARFKSWLGGQGRVSNVHYRNFVTENCVIPIFITQSYYSTEGRDYPEGQYIELDNFTFDNFVGSIDGTTQAANEDASGTWWAVPGLTGRDAIVMQCPSTAACSGLNFDNINIKANYEGSKTTEVWCQNGISETLGFDCVNGTLTWN